MLFGKFLEQKTARGGKKRNFKTSRSRRPAKEVRTEISKFPGARDRHKRQITDISSCHGARDRQAGRANC